MAIADPQPRRRPSLRLGGRDYSAPGVYFVTLCTQERRCLFGEVIEGEMRLSDAGWAMQTTWETLSQAFPGIGTDAFTVMPNHLHGTLAIPEREDAGGGAPDHQDGRMGLVSRAMRHYKSVTTAEYAFGVKHYEWAPFPGRLWQRGFYDHIVRSTWDLERVRRYIANNPARWAYDRENPRRNPMVPPDEEPFETA